MAPSACQIYLVTPPRFDAAAFAKAFAAVLDAGAIACAELALDTADEAVWHRAIAALRPLAQGRGVAFLLADRAELAAETGCDGVRIGATADFAAARRAVGLGMTLGVSVEPTSITARHVAMTAAERGADFVAFGPSTIASWDLVGETVLERVGWWSELFEVPCVAFGAAVPEDCGALSRAGADFVAVREVVWDHSGGAAAGLGAVMSAIRAAGHVAAVRNGG